MRNPEIPADALDLLELIAGAIREELGEVIDAYPGHRDPDAADPINRAYRAVAAAILRRGAADPSRLPALASAALRRLGAESPLPLLTTQQLVEAMAARGANEQGASRLVRLASEPGIDDAPIGG